MLQKGNNMVITETREATPIEIYKITHTNNYGTMTNHAQAAYVRTNSLIFFSVQLFTISFTWQARIYILWQDETIRRKMGPHLQHEPPKTDLQILEEVLNE